MPKEKQDAGAAKEKVKYSNIAVTPEAHLAIKVASAEMRQSISGLVTAIIYEWLDDHKKKAE